MHLCLPCPYCDDDHDVPDDVIDEYGGTFTAPCGKLVELEYDESWDGENEYQFWQFIEPWED